MSGAASGERVIVGIDDSFPPYQYVDAAGRPTGFDLELFRAVAQVEGIEYEVRTGPWYEIRKALEAGEIDVSPGIVATVSRDVLLDFGVPTSLLQHAVFVREDSTIRTRADLKGAAVAVERGTLWNDLIIERYHDIEVNAAKTPVLALQRVAMGEAAAAILPFTQGLFLIRDRGIEGIRSIGTTKETVSMRFAVPEGRADLLAQLNDGLSTIRTNGRYDQLYDHWLGVLRVEPLWERRSTQVLVVATALALGLLLASLLWSRTLRRRVTERTREVVAAEEQQRQLQAQLLQSQKMEALGRLAGGVAHDFNNVLTVIFGGLHAARQVAGDDEHVASAVNAAQTAADSARKLIEQLLTFSRRKEAAIARLNWNPLLDEHREMLSRLLGSTLRLEFDCAPELGDVVIDPSQASQIVLNLVVNARDAIEETGTIAITTSNVEVEGQSFTRLSVRDDGAGIDPETQEHIFEPFFTTKGEEGSGLGLATVFGIVTQAGGFLRVESQLEQGSVFHVDLPPASSS